MRTFWKVPCESEHLNVRNEKTDVARLTNRQNVMTQGAKWHGKRPRDILVRIKPGQDLCNLVFADLHDDRLAMSLDAGPHFECPVGSEPDTRQAVSRPMPPSLRLLPEPKRKSVCRRFGGRRRGRRESLRSLARGLTRPRLGRFETVA